MKMQTSLLQEALCRLYVQLVLAGRGFRDLFYANQR